MSDSKPLISVPLYPLIRKRWSPRAFANKPISRDILERLFEAARWAPSCFNEQPWSFIVGIKGRGRFYEQIASCLVPANQIWAQSAPVLILTLARKKFLKTGKPNRHAAHDLGLAMSQLTLEAMSHDIYVHQMAGFEEQTARDSFSITDEHHVMTVATLGYLGAVEQLPDTLQEKETAPQMRKEISQFVHFE